ncbi:hypothetical protein B4135_1448 [Caldibacillus debilis]|uniref:Uncharacterized protein n=1 Tax=Caldibacillus debilis TaxID=301148 RepID=A0A150MC64_9BACI|nr:hypothetical protein B4135_1448 [Caldibacillus debilis]
MARLPGSGPPKNSFWPQPKEDSGGKAEIPMIGRGGCATALFCREYGKGECRRRSEKLKGPPSNGRMKRGREIFDYVSEGAEQIEKRKTS